MTFTTGIADEEDAFTAGAEAATQASEALDDSDINFCQVFCSSTYEYSQAIDGIRSVIGDRAELIGCASTNEFTDQRTIESGVALGAISSDTLTVQTGIGTDLGDSSRRALREARQDITESDDSYPYRSAIVLYDGLATDGEQLAQQVRRKLGARVPFSGGAASDNYNYESRPVFCNDRIVEDAVVIAVIDSKHRPYVVANHGHEPISEPVEITSTDGKTIKELNNRPAFDVWKEIIAPHAEEMLNLDVETVESSTPEMIQLTGTFEFGINQGEAYKIRVCSDADPEVGTLISQVRIPEGTHVQVMRGTVDSQIDSARQAARTAHNRADSAYSGAFVYDCACRHIILGEEFDTAVDAMREELDSSFVGFETYGEMSMSHGEMSGYHNSTTVINLFPE